MNTGFLLCSALVVCVSVASVVIVRFRVPWPAIAFAAIYGAIALLPLRLLGGSPLQHVGMAPLEWEVRTYGLAAAIVALLLIASGKVELRSVLPIAPVVLWLFIGMTLLWSGSAEQWSGVVQYLFAGCAWVAGCGVGSALTNPDSGRRVATGIAYCIVLVIAVQVAVTVLQVAGVNINALDASDAVLLGSRANGTTNHPNTLGKLLVLSICILLPISQIVGKRMENLCNGAVLASFIPLALAQGRANFIAAVVTLSLWIVIRGLQSGRLQMGMLISVMLLGSVFAGVFVARFSEDPEGGARTELLDLAFTNIGGQPLTGVGPNGYTVTFGPLTGSWIPVHNSFLLVLAEIGLVGLLAFLVPLVVALTSAWRARKNRGISGACAASLTASLPGVLLIAMTGWAMVANIIFPLWFLTVGMLHTTASSALTNARVSPPQRVDQKAPVASSGNITNA